MRKRRIIQVLIMVFIGVNFLLVYLDDEGKIERTAYISKWSESFEADMAEKMYKEGVLTAAGEEQVYFDEKLGTFQEFLVDEGSMVNAGDSLYTYTVDNYYEAEADLRAESGQISGEIAAIETAISQMEMYFVPMNMTETPSAFTLTEDQLEVEFPQTSIEADLLKEQYLVEKEKELSQKRAQLAAVEAQLTELQASGDTITVQSPYAGRISNLNETLDHPVITIEETDLVAIGELTEQERKQMQEGLAAEVEVQEMSTQLEGAVQEVGEKPASIKVDGESMYPFTISFTETNDSEADEGANADEAENLDETESGDEVANAENTEEAEQLLPGYHANLAITMEESPGATVLYEEAVFTDSVWKMTSEGKLVEQGIVTGLMVDSMVEIVEGVEVGDWVAVEPPSLFHHEANFITPLRWKQLTRDSFANTENTWTENIWSGLLSR
ncbi:efflux RND transporter periplasmic adaptor subunit [Oceanobacillus massiliensis]|uniref:efflux RND transporter periplasmic adaptor subunit n=1 Tax=Oceanobacillus massiliensis TaxID=1465765 RepID=UPI0002898A02|nr:efflux RND transporter periplasmic adaptor subunit [Oceanobacillus massiliensis]